MAETKSKFLLLSMLSGILTKVKTFVTKAINEAKPGVATAAKAGLVKAGGTGISIDEDGTINVTDDIEVNPEMLPSATAEKRGGVIIGDGIDVDEEGKINVTHPTNLSEFNNDANYATTADVLLKSDYEIATQAEVDAILTEVFGEVA